MIAIDTICYNSKLRYENSEQKIIYGIITLLIVVGTRSISVAIVALIINTYLIRYKSGLSIRKYLHYMKAPIAFILLSTLSIIINFAQQPLDGFEIWLLLVHASHGIYITCSTESLHFAVQLVLVAIASVTNLYFISFTTPMTDIIMVMKNAKVPSLFLEIMLLIYRYIFILLDMVEQTRRAQQVRLGYKDYRTSLRSFGQLIGMLFIRAMKKSNLLYDAMESRAYNGELRVLYERNQPKRKVTVAIIVYALFLIVIAFAEKRGGIQLWNM